MNLVDSFTFSSVSRNKSRISILAIGKYAHDVAGRGYTRDTGTVCTDVHGARMEFTSL